MNILFMSETGESLSIAERIKKEWHNVHFYIFSKKAKTSGDGLIPKPKYDGTVMKKNGYPIASEIDKLLLEISPDLVIFDMVKMGRVADYIRHKGVAVLGACRWADDAELDRGYGNKLMKQVGINTPPTSLFKSGEYDKAKEFVEKNKKKRYVYKPSGNIETSHTYVSEGAEDMLAMLELWKGDKCDFELQEFMDGVEVSAEIWWNGLFSQAHNITFEEKKFMDGGVGANCGCSGNVVRTVSPQSKIVREGIGRMERLLKKTTYRGAIDLNSIISKDKLYGLEFSIRFGYDAIQSLFELYRGSLTNFFWSVATGGQKVGNFTSDYSIAVRVSIPPYPHTDDKDITEKGIPVIGINHHNEKHIWKVDMYKEGNSLVSAGVDGNILAASARGKDVKMCQQRVYHTIGNLIIPQKQYRRDIGKRVSGDERQLEEWGYL